LNVAARSRRRLRLGLLHLLGLLPTLPKRPLYPVIFGYHTGRNVRIGPTHIDAAEVDLGDRTEIGHFNLIPGVGRLQTRPRERIGILNVTSGGERVRLGAPSTVMRFNVLNAIPDHDCSTAPVAKLDLGDGAIIVSGHRIDFLAEGRVHLQLPGAPARRSLAK
jgi:hypothetical protein